MRPERAHPDYASCTQENCSYSGCTGRGESYDPTDSSRKGCCRRGDREQACHGLGHVCAGNHGNGDCCLADECPSDTLDRYSGCHGGGWSKQSSFYTTQAYCGSCATCGGTFGAFDTYLGLRTICFTSDPFTEIPCRPDLRPLCDN